MTTALIVLACGGGRFGVGAAAEIVRHLLRKRARGR
jgi:hypothetical protein